MAEGHILALLDSAARRVLLQSGRDIEYSQQTIMEQTIARNNAMAT